MSIPSSGKVSIGDIRTELDNAGTESFSLQKAGRPTIILVSPLYTPVNQSSTQKPNNSGPYAISEWYLYNHSENKPCSATSFTTPTLGTFYTYYRVSITGSYKHVSIIQVGGNGTNNHWVIIYLSYPFNSVGQITASPWASGYFSSDSPIEFKRGITSTSGSEVLYFVFYEDPN